MAQQETQPGAHAAFDSAPGSAPAPRAAAADGEANVVAANGWHAIPAADVAAALGTDATRGLSAAEAAARLERHGPNEVAPPPTPRWKYVLEEFSEELREPLVLLLFVVGIVYALSGELRDAAAIFVIILLMAGSEVATELRAKEAIGALQRLSAPVATVIRDGQPQTLPAAEVVPGDLLALRAGEGVPADARLLHSAALRVNESSLTGESLPVEKRANAVLPAAAALAERPNVVFAGTQVSGGHGFAVATATGLATEVGRIVGMVRRAREPRTPLQARMKELSKALLWVALSFSVLVPLLGVLAGLPLREMVLTGISLAFATIPEELPIIITLVLALGGFRLARRHAVVRRLRAAETLGAVTVIGTDKTGTLTENRMDVAAVAVCAASPERATLRALQEGGLETPAAAWVLRAATLASDATALDPAAGTFAGDPMEVALLRAAGRSADVYQLQRAAERALASAEPFDERTRLMSAAYRWEAVRSPESRVQSPESAIHSHDEGRVSVPAGLSEEVVAKGALEAILERCRAAWLADENPLAEGAPWSRTAPLDDTRRDAVRAQAEAFAAEGQRVLAVAAAYRALTAGAELERSSNTASDDSSPGQWVFLGLVGLADPPRAAARAAVAACAAAGVRVVMLTGDHPSTAAAVARAVGIDAEHAITGAEIDALDEDGLARVAATVSVVARATPEHKLRLTTAWQAAREIVAVTGDGVNDAPALRAADVGVAMGGRGTDAAREAADVILTDDNIATVAAAVGEGRVLYDNLRKGVRYYLAAKVALVTCALVAVLLRLPVPFSPLQIILLELFMDLGAAASFAAEPAEGDVMMRPPRDPRAPFFDQPLLVGMGAGAAALAVAVLATYLWLTQQGYGVMVAQTGAVATWLIGHIVLAFHLRTEREPLMRRGLYGRSGLLRNATMLVWGAAAMFFLAGALALPPLRGALHLAPLPSTAWLLIVLAPLIAPLPIEVAKLVLWARHPHPVTVEAH